MPIQFKMCRLLCSTPPELEAERCVFEAQLAEFAEQVTMPAGILFPSASFRPGFDVRNYRSAAESNVRMVEFFAQVFGAEMPDPIYPSLVQLALTCVADPAFPLRRATVFFRSAPEASREIQEFRSALETDPRCEVRDYRDESDLGTQIRATLEGWFALVRP